MNASVIIPTYNRLNSLRELLISLANQSYPIEQFEVIVVDDGSTDNTATIVKEKYPLNLRYVWQTNQGDAVARNTGTEQSQAELLVFLDDDILVEADYLSYLLKEHNESAPKRIVVGTEYLWLKDTPPFNHPLSIQEKANNKSSLAPLTFVDVCSNNMSLRRRAYYAIGKMQSLDFPGSSIWCDVDFAYRAYLQGFEFYRSTKAICYHRDYTVKTLSIAAKRQHDAAYRAVTLFQKYPDLLSHIPMFRDKTPITWHQDSFGLVVRKLARHVNSSQPILRGMEKLVRVIEQYYPISILQTPLSRWIIGGYMFQGYRKGLRDFGPVIKS